MVGKRHWKEIWIIKLIRPQINGPTCLWIMQHSFKNPSLWELFPSCREPDRKQKNLIFLKQTIPCLSLCRWVLLTTRREERIQTMKQAPCPRAVNVGKNKTKAKPLNKHNGLVYYLSWGTKQDRRTLFSSPPPTPPWHSGPWLPALLSPVLPRHGADQQLDSPDCSFNPPTSIAAL